MMCCQLKHINHCGNYPMVSPVPICIVKYTWWLFFFAGQCISWQLYDDYDLLTADNFSGPILIGLVRSSWWTKWIIFFPQDLMLVRKTAKRRVIYMLWYDIGLGFNGWTEIWVQINANVIWFPPKVLTLPLLLSFFFHLCPNWFVLSL